MTVNHRGKLLTLTQEPYLDRIYRRIYDAQGAATAQVIDGNVYRANATDAQSYGYIVFWTRLTETEDGLDVADWDEYVVAEV
jgi:hypothetical protein